MPVMSFAHLQTDGWTPVEEREIGKGDDLQADSDKIGRGSTSALKYSRELVSSGGPELIEWLYTTKGIHSIGLHGVPGLPNNS